MENGGNSKVNALFEARLPSSTMKIQAGANGSTRERYIRDKYERRKYYDPVAAALDASGQEDDDSESEDEIESPVSKSSVSRAAAAARMRAEAKIKNGSQRVNKFPIKIPKSSAPAPPPAPEVDLLDFGSFNSNQNTTHPAPPSKPGTPQSERRRSNANEIGDLFGGLTMSNIQLPAAQNTASSTSQSNENTSWTSAFVNSASIAPNESQRKTNEDILAMFNTPQQSSAAQVMMMQHHLGVDMHASQQRQLNINDAHLNNGINGHQQSTMYMQTNQQMVNNSNLQNMHNQNQTQMMYNQQQLQMMMNHQQQVTIQQKYPNMGNMNQTQIPMFDAQTQMKQQEQQMMMTQEQGRMNYTQPTQSRESFTYFQNSNTG